MYLLTDAVNIDADIGGRAGGGSSTKPIPLKHLELGPVWGLQVALPTEGAGHAYQRSLIVSRGTKNSASGFNRRVGANHSSLATVPRFRKEISCTQCAGWNVDHFWALWPFYERNGRLGPRVS